MQRRTLLKLSVLGVAGSLAGGLPLEAAPTAGSHEPAPDGKPHRFALGRQQFLLDERPFQVRSGEMHPIRIPPMYWRHRIRMAKAMGLNTIAIYIIWNTLESEPGVFDLSTGARDFVRFIELCAEEGMWVYLRPGPYVCAEWDFGGLPAYLLRDPHVRVRDKDDVRYMDAVRRYLDAIAPRIAPLMAGRGGPVLMLQVENEYASFGKDLSYLQQLQALWRERGIDGPFSISDGLAQIRDAKTYLPGTALGLDGDTDFATAQAIAGEMPVWVGEGYPGWLTHWGDARFQREDYASTLAQLLAAGHSFNLYVVHGGSNFGFGAGANANRDGGNFEPVITSYDYGAPIDERGAPTADYHRFRAMIGKTLKRPLPAVPATPEAAGFEPVTPAPWASLWDGLPAAKAVQRPQSNEELFGQNQGLVLYRKRVRGRTLDLRGVHDYATVFADGRYLDYVSRVQKPGLRTASDVALPAAEAEVMLDILIDSFGHVGYGPAIGDRKGLVGGARLDGRELLDWDVFSLPLDERHMSGLGPWREPPAALRPGLFFRAELAREAPADCYLDMSAWNKGYVWVNRRLLGRYWNLGPQQRLYCPASWWQGGTNEILVLDLHRTEAAPIGSAITLHD
ncbi:beta-galactosidase [Frateuria defendens]|uniref:beta-galactosidase n=1 Tax=Frateuria defendens TaxID=2219559 RepID=UPI00066FF956|nr:beta-galactosidase [Frateuria defendens]